MTRCARSWLAWSVGGALACLGAIAPLALAAPTPSATAAQGVQTPAATHPTADWPPAAKDWLPWAMQGHEALRCPRRHDDGQPLCVWPGQLKLSADANGAQFSLSVTVYGAATWVSLPGEEAAWPHEVKSAGKAVAVSAREGAPAVWLEPGRHVLEGQMAWAAMPQDVKLPTGVGALELSVNGRTERRQPSADGRLWLRQGEQAGPQADEAVVRTHRRVEDGIPMMMNTRFELTVSGKARELDLPLAVLPGWVPHGLDSRLPVRLQEDGRLKVQARPGQWSIEVQSRHLKPLAKLELPAGGASAEESWSFAARNELRLVGVEGAASIDPKQVAMPEDWRSLPAYRLKPGESLKLLETRRGNADPGPDRLALKRLLWLDFDGQGYTAQDQVSGKLSRSTRLEMAAPGLLGRASVGGEDQLITQLSPQSPLGVAVRDEALQLQADSRIEGSQRALSASGWLSDFDSVQVDLKLPPGWRLLHASGPDAAPGSWVARWTLWDFFFVLLSALAAGKLLGWRTGLLLGAALVLAWHMSGTPPRWLWLAVLGAVALLKVWPHTPARRWLQLGGRAMAACLALALLPYAVDQVRLSMYPALEHPTVPAGAMEDGKIEMMVVQSKAELPPPPAEMDASMAPLYSKRAMMSPPAPPAAKTYGIDPRARVQTGPGLPRWSWTEHPLSWQGPVQKNQSLRLWLLPPWATALLRIGSLLLMAAALWQLLRQGGLWPGEADPPATHGESGEASSHRSPEGPTEGGTAAPPAPAGAMGAPSTASGLAALCVLGLACVWPQPGLAAPRGEGASPGIMAPAPAPAVNPSLPWPSEEQLETLRQRAHPAPACLPNCVDVARLWVSAAGSRISLRLELHAQAAVALPLPGQGSHWQPHTIGMEGQAATVRRDEAGVLWLSAPKGLSQVLLEADAQDHTSVDITLPLPVREVKARLEGWALSGLDARGLASGALMLAREAPRNATADRSTERDSLPPLVRVQRQLQLGLSWEMLTVIERISPSRAPLQVSVQLLPGESVTDESVKVEGGVATVQLGQQDSLTLNSRLQPSAQALKWVASGSPQQIEQWSVTASPQWQLAMGERPGIPPVWHFQEGRWNPQWQPWPGESLSLNVLQPQGVQGQTFTIDRVQTTLSPGARASDYSSQITLRSSLGGNHRMQLPAEAQLQEVALNGQALPLRLEKGLLTLPVPPGEHQLSLKWRVPEGMGTLLRNTPLQAGSPGVNDELTLRIPADRFALAMGGPVVGPAALLWGAVLVMLAVAAALSRLRDMPLGGVAWALLGLGLAPVSLWGLGWVLAWFLALRARSAWAPQALAQPKGRWVFNGVQVLLVLGALLVASVLLHALQVGLLGYPDLMIAGNGSSARELHWYADRFGASTSQAWVLSMPVWLYRVLMLLWALWLASAVLGWLRWAWAQFSAGGVWKGKPPGPVKP